MQNDIKTTKKAPNTKKLGASRLVKAACCDVICQQIAGKHIGIVLGNDGQIVRCVIGGITIGDEIICSVGIDVVADTFAVITTVDVVSVVVGFQKFAL